ncbi:GNAT family N-acetyltransferase [Aminobacter aganoensis]|uniref:GNAT superfamily N-acetyltransferase n=1 Tax=Aminobacter aganoensis TaxID=83264 RepID=A0A7X0F3W5_9HYPH|nr:MULTISPECIES: GNAT family N-acetyltransferase [Aminobacter]KQU69991.1 acetyltransferase [Aminobacter sp. DSM 101952]MBB6352631.1 GNAT superfamily N-acetyltransferase [Aminobacter aganoensis]
MAVVEISFDLSRIDFGKTSEVIKASYWGAERSDEINRRAFDNSLCVGAYLDRRQVGFARVVTDNACFAYVCDVIVWPEHRGLGIGTGLVQALLDHPDLASVTGWSLRTSDAHGLYNKFGFEVSNDGMYMRLARQPAAHA